MLVKMPAEAAAGARAVEAYRHQAVWRYNIVTARAPHPSDAV